MHVLSAQHTLQVKVQKHSIILPNVDCFSYSNGRRHKEMHVTQMWRRHFEKSEFFMQKSCARRNSIIIVDLLKMLKIVYIQVFIKSLLTNCLNSCCFQGKTMLLNTGLWKVGIHKRYFLLFQFKRIVRRDSWGNIFLQCKLVEITAVIRTLQFLMDILECSKNLFLINVSVQSDPVPILWVWSLY